MDGEKGVGNGSLVVGSGGKFNLGFDNDGYDGGMVMMVGVAGVAITRAGIVKLVWFCICCASFRKTDMFGFSRRRMKLGRDSFDIDSMLCLAAWISGLGIGIEKKNCSICPIRPPIPFTELYTIRCTSVFVLDMKMGLLSVRGGWWRWL
ncbi:unnamed protein product [Ilex paraguariensis]|uniref:Transmembrane protein n=1 Tax=Ilex paraguariensis TaxID=185542 RepID=A0ABC8RM70_9AQUA